MSEWWQTEEGKKDLLDLLNKRYYFHKDGSITERNDSIKELKSNNDNNWIRCQDELPKEEGEYLTYVVDNGCSYLMKIQRFYTKPIKLAGMYKDCFTHWQFTAWDDNIVTHWMPLPPSPEEYNE